MAETHEWYPNDEVDSNPDREVRCPRCYGTGEDPKVEDADCLECWGDGTILLEN